MNEGARNLWVGAFVVVSLGALAVLMVWFGEAPSWMGGSEWSLRIAGVRELQGIGEGSPVNLNGVEIGRVRQLEFEDAARPDQGVVVVARIKNTYSIPVGAHARIYGATMGFGTGRVEICVEPGGSITPLPIEGAEIRGEMRSVIGELISKDLVGSVERAITNVANLTEEWAPVGTNLAQMLERRSVAMVDQPGAQAKGITPNLATAVERIDKLIENLNAVLGDPDIQGDVKIVVRDLRDASEELKKTISLWNRETERLAENVNSTVDKTTQNLDDSFGRLNEVLENLDSATRSLMNVMEGVARGEGTAGLLARDERLYEAAVLSLNRFEEVMQNLLIITGKIKEDGYIIVGQAPSGVLKKRLAVPAGAAESP